MQILRGIAITFELMKNAVFQSDILFKPTRSKTLFSALSLILL